MSSRGKRNVPVIEKPKEPRRRQVPPQEPNPELETLNANQRAAQVEMEALARSGERLDRWVKDGHYNTLNEEILAPLEAQTINSLKSDEFDLENRAQLYEFRAALKLIGLIRERIQARITHGLAARVQLIQQQTTPQENL